MGSSSSSRPLNKQLKNYISWFEIPALNIQRATAFYNQIYQINMEVVESNGYSMAVFPTDSGIGGAVVMGLGSTPSEFGSLVYLNAGNDLTAVLNRIEAAGGRIVMPKTMISEDVGFFALFIDTEGNKLALHSKK
ncbi:MAG: putative enzyme related to lactoylglutathione lyase [Arenicella sp.]|jgi:predicted enzyme related to lactoylglutathione lyase